MMPLGGGWPCGRWGLVRRGQIIGGGLEGDIKTFLHFLSLCPWVTDSVLPHTLSHDGLPCHNPKIVEPSNHDICWSICSPKPKETFLLTSWWSQIFHHSARKLSNSLTNNDFNLSVHCQTQANTNFLLTKENRVYMPGDVGVILDTSVELQGRA